MLTVLDAEMFQEQNDRGLRILHTTTVYVPNHILNECCTVQIINNEKWSVLVDTKMLTEINFFLFTIISIKKK